MDPEPPRRQIPDVGPVSERQGRRARLGPGVVVGELGQGRDGLTGGRGPAATGRPAAGGDPEPNLLRVVQDLTGATVTEARSLLADHRRQGLRVIRGGKSRPKERRRDKTTGGLGGG